MQCEEVREQIASHLDAELPPEIADHVATCEACSAEVEQIRSVWMLMDAIPTPQPDVDARARFDLMVDAYQQGRDQSSSSPVLPILGRWWLRQPVLQFGAAAALLLVGVFAGWQLRPSPAPAAAGTSSTELAEVRGELTAMRQIVALSLMQQQSASERLRGVSWSQDLQQPGAEVLTALLEALMHDSNINVRLATIDALRQFGDKSVVRKGIIEAMRNQESPMVQVALIDLAVDMKDRDSIATLREFAQNQKLDVAVRERAQKGLTELE